MYYISDNRSDLEAYNNLVSIGERYDGQTTIKWANVIEHKDGNLFAILKNDKYETDLQTLANLDNWFNLEI
jgi:hypothetical protein